MIVNIWRYSHFILAASSCLFVFIATLTGLILAFAPIQIHLQSNKVTGGEELSLAHVVEVLNSQYDEVLELEVDDNYFVSASVVGMEEGKNGDFYINPKTGEKLAEIQKKSPFFEWVTNFHRSLFLKTIGRMFIGVTSFLLFLISLTGCILLIKRQKGIRHFFDKIKKEDFAQHYHIILGRLTLLPILIITLTGIYLSLLRFSILPEEEGQTTIFESPTIASPEQSLSDFKIFKETKLKDIRKLEFPFSEDIEELFILRLHDRELKVNQKTGAILSEVKFPFIDILSKWNFKLHTGTGSLLWSIILAIAAVNILFFMYSGAMISYKRIKSKNKNRYTSNETDIVILIGSENGNTQEFSRILQEQLLKTGNKVYVGFLNQYQKFAQLKNLIILTSTYGDGDPPANASRFLKLLNDTPPAHPFHYSVVGFGSKAYPKFCQYAVEVDTALFNKAYCHQVAPPALIHNRSYSHFKKWAKHWSEKAAIKLNLPENLKTKKEKLQTFQIQNKSSVKGTYDETFVLTLKPSKYLKFQSGDLLAVYPPNDSVERLYSIGKSSSGQMLLSIKVHEYGLCSNYLNSLKINGSFQARLEKNKAFHLPRKIKSAVLIANGTGIAPFLGMIQGKRKTAIRLYWGGRTVESLSIYQAYIKQALNSGSIHQFKAVYSKENSKDKYVQDILRQDEELIAQQIDTGAIFMICGSLSMQQDTLTLLGSITMKYLDKTLDHYLEKGQILMDCY